MRNELHTPWSDEIALLAFDPTKDAAGYIASPGVQPRTVFCTWEDGVSQNEFYRSMKEGLQASASVELWAADYQGERFVTFNGTLYRVLRAFQSSFDCKTLILSEVIR